MTFNVLVVDDEEDNRECIRYFLKDCDCVCFEVSHATEAMLEMNMRKFDLVITDFNMPVMNGIQLTKNIRLVNTSIPILLCTNDINITEADAKYAGATRLISKDDANVLRETVEKYINQKKQLPI